MWWGIMHDVTSVFERLGKQRGPCPSTTLCPSTKRGPCSITTGMIKFMETCSEEFSQDYAYKRLQDSNE